MVKARTDFKMTVRKFISELEKAKTKRLIDANYKNAKEYWKLLKDAANTNTSTPKSLSTKHLQNTLNPLIILIVFSFSQMRIYYIFSKDFLIERFR